jgi:hypothetical protein
MFVAESANQTVTIFQKNAYLTKIWYRSNTKCRFNFDQKRVLAYSYRNMRLIT